jgi:hypothetical protein
VPQRLDIFRIQTEGGVRWIGTAENLEPAKALIKAESEKQPGDFLMVNLKPATKWKSRLTPPPKNHAWSFLGQRVVPANRGSMRPVWRAEGTGEKAGKHLIEEDPL